MTIAEFLIRFEQEGAAFMDTLYIDCRPVCVGTLKKQKVETEKALDIYREAVLLLFENAYAGKVRPGDAKVSTYLTKVCLNLAHRGKASQWQALPLLDEEETDGAPEEHEIKWARLEKCIDNLDERRRQLVQLWMEGTAHRKIAEQLGYAGENSSKTTFYQCLKTLYNCLKPYL